MSIFFSATTKGPAACNYMFRLVPGTRILNPRATSCSRHGWIAAAAVPVQRHMHSMSGTSNMATITCQCGTVSLRASRPKPLDLYVCHCTECQKQSASAFGVSAIFPAQGMWPLPESMRRHIGVWTRPTDSGNTLECYFCKCCGVRILHRAILPDGTPKPTLSVKAGCLAEFTLEGAKHIYTRTARVPVPEGSEPGPPRIKPGMKTE